MKKNLKTILFSLLLIFAFVSCSTMHTVISVSYTHLLTVGNRKVNNNEIKFNKIINELANKIGLNKIQEFSRNIPTSKKIAVKTSRLANGKSVNSINTVSYTHLYILELQQVQLILQEH